MNDIDRDDARRHFVEWQQAKEEEIDAASRADLAELELEDMGIDTKNPPDWIKE